MNVFIKGKRFLILFSLFLFSVIGVSSSFPEDNKKQVKVPFWPTPPAETRIRFVSSFSSPEDIGVPSGGFFKRIRDLLIGRRSQRMVRPYGIAIGPGGNRIYVSDPGLGVVHIFDRRKHSYSMLSAGGGDKFISPIGVALDDKGRLFVSDTKLRKVFVFSNKLKYLFSLGDRENLQRPTGIVFAQGKLYVVDTSGHQVVVYDGEGNYLFRFGRRGSGEGTFNFPTGITASAAGRLYINDSMNFRVQVFNLEGKFLSIIGGPGDSSGYFSRPKGVALDSDDNLYVVDALFDTVQIFNREGRFLLNFGEAGEKEGEFWLPAGIAIDKQDRIYVADSYNRRIQIFQYLSRGSIP